MRSISLLYKGRILGHVKRLFYSQNFVLLIEYNSLFLIQLFSCWWRVLLTYLRGSLAPLSGVFLVVIVASFSYQSLLPSIFHFYLSVWIFPIVDWAFSEVVLLFVLFCWILTLYDSSVAELCWRWWLVAEFYWRHWLVAEFCWR